MIELISELIAYPGVPQILGGALTAVGTVSAVIWSSWRQAYAERNRSQAHALNFSLQATHVAHKIGELLQKILDSNSEQANDQKELVELEREAGRQQSNFSSFPIHELPLPLVPIAHDFRAIFAEIYMYCSDAVKGGEPVDRDFKVTVLALHAQGSERLEEFRKHARTKYDDTKYTQELIEKMENINEELEQKERELESQSNPNQLSTRAASKTRSWWPF